MVIDASGSLRPKMERFWLPLRRCPAALPKLGCPTSPDVHEASRGADGAWL